ncbi:MAG: hypothetical protein Q9181_008337, partial [Wetmoreana brouardii]
MIERLVKRTRTSVTTDHEARGRRIFAWVTFSTRPLSVSELRDALAVRPQHTEEVNLATFDLDRLQTTYADFGDTRENSVQLIHQTVREFLLGKDRLAQPYDMDEHFGDTEIAGTCCRYIHLAFMAEIAQNEAGTTYSLAGKLAEHLSNWHLLPYALKNLATHLNHLGLKSPATLAEFERFIMEVKEKPTSYSSLLLSLWLQSQSWPKTLCIPTEPNGARECLDSTLMCAASEGQTKALVTLLILGASASKALYMASYGGHVRVVAMLIEAGADVNIRGGRYGNALQAASARGHEKVVRMLLDHGADINALGGLYGNALEAASARGHEEV